MAMGGPTRIGSIGLVLVASLVVPVAGGAATFVAKVFEDVNDGLCTPVGAMIQMPCSLREAVIKANEFPGKDTIELLEGAYELTIDTPDPNPAATGDLDVWDDLDIVGPTTGEARIVGTTADNVLHVWEDLDHGPASPLLQLSDITISGGLRAVLAYKSDVYLWRVTVEDCGANAANACGLWSEHGVVLVTDSWFRRNTGDAALYVYDGTLLVIRSTISDTFVRGSGAGAIYCRSSLANLVNTTITGTAGVYGSGFWSLGCSATIDSCTIAGNHVGIATSPTTPGSTVLRNTYHQDWCGATTGSIISEGGNVGDAGACELDHSTDIDVAAVPDVLVMPLGHYGGHTPTMLPTAGPNLLVDNPGAASHCQTDDQRGVDRALDGGPACDTGAVERVLGDPLWADGFETGDTSAWSATVP